jgi:hypothetical protein
MHKFLIGGGLAASLVGGVAYAASHGHTMTVDLPSGQVAHITYFGDTPPQVKISAPEPDGLAFDDTAFAPFAEMNRISAIMDARMNEMMRRVSELRGPTVALSPESAPQMVAFAGLPKGTQVHYSYSSTTIGSDGCAQTVNWTSDGASAAQPKMTKTSSGNCAAAPEAKPQTVSAPAASAARPSRTT